MKVNGPEGSNQDKDEIPGSWQSIRGYHYSDLPQALKGGETVSYGVSRERTAISASAVPHCELQGRT